MDFSFPYLSTGLNTTFHSRDIQFKATEEPHLAPPPRFKPHDTGPRLHFGQPTCIVRGEIHGTTRHYPVLYDASISILLGADTENLFKAGAAHCCLPHPRENVTVGTGPAKNGKPSPPASTSPHRVTLPAVNVARRPRKENPIIRPRLLEPRVFSV